MWGNTSENSLGCQKDVVAEIISAHSLWISHRVDLSKGLDDLCPLLVVLRMVNYDAASTLLPLLNCRELFLVFDCLGYETSGVSLDQH